LARGEAVLELHIEQGNRLETGGIQIGAVTGIVGIYRYIVTVKGEAGKGKAIVRMNGWNPNRGGRRLPGASPNRS